MKHLFVWLLGISVGVAQMPLKRLLVDGKTQPLQTHNTLQITNITNDIVLDFEAIQSDSVLYFYRMAALNENWTQSLYPSAHYQNLGGGHYTFEIYAQSPRTKTPPTQIRIEVKLAFWQTLWFKVAVVAYVVLIIGIVIYFFFLYTFRQKLKMLHVRSQIASDLHDEVGANLSSIAIFVALLRQKVNLENPALLAILDRITSNSEETVTLMRDTVWAINPANDSTEKLFERMRSFGAEILSAKGVAFDFQCNDATLKKVAFSMDQRRNLYLIYKEAINNTAKHAQATKASVVCSLNDGKFSMRITDNGVGFDLQKTFEGNGLKNFKLRSQGEDIRVETKTQSGQGTQVVIEIIP